jgi:hypothetical protein
MGRFALIIGCTWALAATACLETRVGEEGDEGLSSTESPLTMLNRAQVDQAQLHANHGGTAAARSGTNAGNDGTGRVAWKQGGFTPGGSNQVSVCNYGWCGFPSVGSGCQGSESSWGYSYGACNSSAWGQRFGGYFNGTGVDSSYKSGVTGTTTFGYHPYWGVVYNGQCQTHQGWSYTTHSCSGLYYTVNNPSVCGDGTCQSDETCGSCAADCGACPACGDGACNGSEDCTSCAGDCGVCPPGIHLTNLSGGDKYYTLTVPAEGDQVTISMSGGSGDCDLHVKKNASVSTGSYDCRPYTSGNNETCTFTGGGTYNILLDQYSSWSGVSLNADFTVTVAPACGDGTCNGSETCGSCPNDCGACPSCGDGSCNGSEDCGSCAADCGACSVGGECAQTSSCGSQAPSGCWCDSACSGYGDCCTGKVADCG